jgi:hypothetical protein
LPFSIFAIIFLGNQLTDGFSQRKKGRFKDLNIMRIVNRLVV